jgi:hypothetical protein
MLAAGNLLNPKAVISSDLGRADCILSERCECVLYSQMLQFIKDVHPVVGERHRCLKARGVPLASVSCSSQSGSCDMNGGQTGGR